jgi:hypothetical protein
MAQSNKLPERWNNHVNVLHLDVLGLWHLFRSMYTYGKIITMLSSYQMTDDAFLP